MMRFKLTAVILLAVQLMLLSACIQSHTVSAPTGPAQTATPAASSTPTGIGSEATSLEAEPTEVPPTPMPTPSPLPTPFSLIWISDTQNMTYHEGREAAFLAMGQWISDNSVALNIQLVMHTGDVVENGWRDSCWDKAEPALDAFRHDVPFIAIAGNHDLGSKKQDYSAYLERDFVKNMDVSAVYEGGRGVCIEFTAGGIDFIVAGIGWNSDDAAREWLYERFSARPDAVGILISHSYLNEDASRTSEGVILSKTLLPACPNIKLVLCGHRRGVARIDERIEAPNEALDYRSVPVLLFNYQAESRLNHLGYLRILSVDPVARSIGFKTYSPYLDDYNYYAKEDTSAEEFVLEDIF